MARFDLANPVWQWWLSLSAAGIVNLALWAWVRRGVLATLPADPADARLQRRLVQLAGLYAFVCAFRSLVPRADVQRITLFDSFVATVLVGRAAATVAELAFVRQWSLAMERAAEVAGVRTSLFVSRAAVPLIAVAECFSWYAVLSTNYLGNVVEESLWATVGALAVLGCGALALRFREPFRRALWICVGCGLVYVAFMALHDVPMYVSRFRADEAAHRVFFTFAAGLRDVATRRVVTASLDDWREEMPWMTFYFTLSVWFSLGLATLQLARKRVESLVLQEEGGFEAARE
jgi:hypothetical protein